MRLSEAILLGDSLKLRNPYAWLDVTEDGDTCGCALGGAILAAGDSAEEYFQSSNGFYDYLFAKWPWVSGYTSAIGGMYARGMPIEKIADEVRKWEDELGVYADNTETECQTGSTAQVAQPSPEAAPQTVLG